MCPRDADRMANSIDPDQTAPEEQSDLGLYCLPRPVYLKSLQYAKTTGTIMVQKFLTKLWANCEHKYSTAQGGFHFPTHPSGQTYFTLQSHSRLHSNITCNFMILTL